MIEHLDDGVSSLETVRLLLPFLLFEVRVGFIIAGNNVDANDGCGDINGANCFNCGNNNGNGANVDDIFYIADDNNNANADDANDNNSKTSGRFFCSSTRNS